MKVGKEEEKNWIATAAGICTLSYLVGYFELSLIYVLLLSILYVALVVRHLNKTSTGSQGLITKEQVLAKLEATVNTKDEAELARLRLNLPEWLRFTDIHKTQWLNFLVERLWPKMSEAIGDSLRWSIIPMLEANKPAFLSELGLSHVDMGSTPLFITGARIHETRESAVMLDLGVVMDLDTNIVLRASKCGVAFNIVISHVQFQGDLRLVLCPLVPQWPCFSGMKISFASRPEIDFDLNIVGIPIMDVTGLDTMVRNIIKDGIEASMLWPLSIPIDILWRDLVEEQRKKDRSAEGSLRVQVLQANDIASRIQTGLNNMDAYVSCTVSKVTKNTAFKRNDFHPKFDEEMEFVVYHKASETIEFTLFDKSAITSAHIGKTSFNISTLKVGQWVYYNLPLNGVSQGYITVRMQYIPFLPRGTRAIASNIGSFGEAFLFMQLQRCMNLYASDGVCTSYVKASLGASLHRSKTVKDTCNPSWEDCVFVFPVMDATNEQLKLTINDQNTFSTNEMLGNLNINLSDIPSSGVVDNVYDLENCNTGQVDMRLELLYLNTATVEAAVEPLPRFLAGTARFTVHRAQDLIAADANGKSDPFCEVSIIQSSTDEMKLAELGVNVHKNTKYRTKVCTATLNPVWEESFHLAVTNAANQSVLIKVFDHDTLSNNDSIGDFFIPLTEMIKEWPSPLEKKGKSFFERVLTLNHAGHGQIVVTMELDLLCDDVLPMVEADVEAQATDAGEKEPSAADDTAIADTKTVFKLNFLPGLATCIATGGTEAIVKIQDRDAYELDWQKTQGGDSAAYLQPWVRFKSDERMKILDIGCDDSLWGLNVDGKVFEWNSTFMQWKPHPTPGSGKLISISVADAEHIVVVTNYNEIYVWNAVEEEWLKLPSLALHASIGADGEMWCINKKNEIMRYDMQYNAWSIVPGSGQEVHVVSKHYVLVLKEGCIHKWRGKFQGWKMIDCWKPCKTDELIATMDVAYDGTIVCQNAENQIFMCPGTGEPAALADTAAKLGDGLYGQAGFDDDDFKDVGAYSSPGKKSVHYRSFSSGLADACMKTAGAASPSLSTSMSSLPSTPRKGGGGTAPSSPLPPALFSPTPKRSGRLTVSLVRAINLKSIHKNGLTSNPYVKLYVGKQTKKSVVVKKTINPLFGEKHTFYVKDARRESLFVQVKNQDYFGVNKILGEVRIPLTRVANHIQHNIVGKKYPLVYEGIKYGDIYLNLRMA